MNERPCSKNQLNEMFSGINKKAVLIQIFSIIIIGFLVYLNSLNCSFHFDDISGILENSKIRNINNIKEIWNHCPSRFIPNYTIALNFAFNKFNVTGYHIFNICIHIINSILVYFLTFMLIFLLKRFKLPFLGEIDKFSNIPFFVSLVFLSHPVQTMAVTYIIQRMESMSTLFYLSSCICFIIARYKYLEKGWGNPIHLFFYILTFLFGFLGIFTKEVCITIPVMFVIIETYFFRDTKFDFKYLLPFFVIPFVLILLMIIKGPYTIVSGFCETTDISRFHYLLTEFKVMSIYIGLLVFPYKQNFDYNLPISKSFFEPQVLFSFLLISFFIYLIFYFYKKDRFISFGILWFFVLLSVTSSIFPIQDVIFEFRLYPVIFGFAIFFTSFISAFLKAVDKKAIINIVFAIIIIIFSILSINRNKVYQNEMTLWADVVKKAPYNSRGYYNLGSQYQRSGDTKNGIKYLEKAYDMDPKSCEIANDLGVAYLNQGRFDDAKVCFERALGVEPRFSMARLNLADVYMRKGDYRSAFLEFGKVIKTDPTNANAYEYRGFAFYILNDYDSAISDFKYAIELNPYNPNLHNKFGVILLAKNDIRSAENEFTRACELDPLNAPYWYNLGFVLAKSNKNEGAVNCFKKCIELDPNFIGAYKELGTIYFNNSDRINCLYYLERYLRFNINEFEKNNAKKMIDIINNSP